jgi:hypothetical protein
MTELGERTWYTTLIHVFIGMGKQHQMEVGSVVC